MKDNKKEQERAELHRMIWGIANDLCGSVDGWDFKQNVLGMLSYRYISENLTNYINAGEHIAAIKDFDYANLAGKEAKKAIQDIINIKGYFIFLGELFENVRKKAAKDENLNETLERVFNNIERSAKGAESELSFAGLFADFDVSSNKFGATVAKYNEHLIKLMNSVSEMKPDGYRDNIIDAFGDAYEYLMGMYQSSAGKYGGEFYNPQEVSELLTRITIVDKSKVNKVYNPACGLGSLLLNFAKIFGQKNVRKGFYWQKVNLTTYNLCRINIFLHDINYDKFDIAHEDTFKDPQHLDYEPFEAVVSNPPYSIKWEGDGNQLLINDLRFFPAGILAPKSKADLAFIMHSLSWLATNGTAAIVFFSGILYRGGAEQKIRKYLVDNNYVDCVIQLLSNLFFGTTMATCIIVLKKSKSKNNTFFIDADEDYVKITNNNKLTDSNILHILKAYGERKIKEYFSKLVSNKSIAEKEYTLSVNSYVEQKDTCELVDIKVLNAKIKRQLKGKISFV